VAFQYFSEKLSVNPVSKEAVQSCDPLSRDEIYRLCRALYHFELYCFLFVSRELSEEGPYREESVGLGGSQYQLSQRFLPNLNALEAEEIACIREYLFDYYTKAWKNCAGELDQLWRCQENGKGSLHAFFSFRVNLTTL